MQKVVFVIIFMFFILFAIQNTSLINNVKIDNIQIVSCTYFSNKGNVCGEFYIVHNNRFSVLSFGESVVLDKSLDIQEFLHHECEIVRSEILPEQGKQVYLLYFTDLPKYKILDNKKYNLQVVINKDYTKIGYPSIFDSF